MSHDWRSLYIGLMSGTSVDAIDAVVVDFSNGYELVATLQHEIPPHLRNQILSLCEPGENEISRMGRADIQMATEFSTAVLGILEQNQLSARDIIAIGCHGQTIRHEPDCEFPYTLQISDPSRIALLTGITTIADFRNADIAAGGQGAPLVPAFHQRVFASGMKNRAILNIGGISNFTLIPRNATQSITGFDSGPGNVLMDEWASRLFDQPFDRNGDIAGSGAVDTQLLSILLSEPYLKLAPPKSTGRELFNFSWLERMLASNNNDTKPEDVLATLAEYTATCIANDLTRHFTQCDEIFICGGGAYNPYLCSRIESLSCLPVQSTQKIGIDPNWVEGIAFAWLAKQTLEKKPGNVPSVTGANQYCILGGIYQAG